ncbi:phosphoglucosamine mutase [Bythopirellula polymerisocia]|uniref:Phosphomannomutase/phosphoglucomutase n=1 Tax=Bythopirellula polymerisocia TaxID=2528003 RepID=A0A5C6D122_9BACT|nr:phosphoglucosamine mutase [Bythopirellula polymerisocia]TWU28579.1 Phosphomannomutase/phosphoglucomutase [Bythopirellula polymerisocia]
MSDLIISVSGLRGVVGDSLTPEIAIRFVNAFCLELPPGPIVVTSDGRHTGPMVASAVQSALLAAGRDCLDGGVAATPTTGVLVRHHDAVGGIQISASHNPPEYNGLKLFDAKGRVIPSAAGQRVLDRFQSGQTPWKMFDQLGVASSIEDTTSAHLELVLAICDVERIRARQFRVLVDANHGSGSVLALPLLEALGCEVTMLGGTPDGLFAHPPEPTCENLSSVLSEVRNQSAAIGFCQDPDADRLAVIDELGRYVGEEFTLAMVADHVLRRTPGAIITNCSTSRMTQDLAEKYGVPFIRSMVGEANVVDKMIESEAVLGGEGNGGVIDPRVGLVRDSFVGMGYLLDAMAAREMPISALADELPQYAICKSKVTLPGERVAESFYKLENHFADAKGDRLDGLRLDWPDKWLLIRASNTEPIVRIIAEAPMAAEAKSLCNEAAALLS